MVLQNRRHLVRDRVWGAPDLVVEVLSPHPRIGRLDERLAWFAWCGVRECWLVNQLVTQVEVVALTAGQIDTRTINPVCPASHSSVLPRLDVTPAAMLG